MGHIPCKKLTLLEMLHSLVLSLVSQQQSSIHVFSHHKWKAFIVVRLQLLNGLFVYFFRSCKLSISSIEKGKHNQMTFQLAGQLIFEILQSQSEPKGCILNRLVIVWSNAFKQVLAEIRHHSSRARRFQQPKVWLLVLLPITWYYALFGYKLFK